MAGDSQNAIRNIKVHGLSYIVNPYFVHKACLSNQVHHTPCQQASLAQYFTLIEWHSKVRPGSHVIFHITGQIGLETRLDLYIPQYEFDI